MHFTTAEILIIVGSCLSICCNQLQKNTTKETIYLLTLLPYYNPVPFLNPSWNDGDNIQPVLELAKDQINKNESLLENYTLELIHAESGCNHIARTSVDFVKEAFYPHRDNLTGIIGPGCSSSSVSLAPLTNRSELGIVVLHGSGSNLLACRTEYPYLLGTLGSIESFVNGFMLLLKEGKWTKIAVLYDDSRLYHKSTKRQLLKKIPKNVSVEFVSAVSFTYLPLEIIQQSLVRVIFVMCPIELSLRIICLSKHIGMEYPNYQWVFTSQIYYQLKGQAVNFVYGSKTYHCSGNEIANTLNKYFLLIYRLVPSESVQLISNTTYQEYKNEYEAYREAYNIRPDLAINSSYSFWATYFYDIVWAWALVLDNLTKYDDGFMLHKTYGNLSQTKMIVEQFYRTTFQGISGEIVFDRKSGFAQRLVNISQILNGSEIFLGSSEEEAFNSSMAIFIPDSFHNETIRDNLILGSFLCFVTLIQLCFIALLQVSTVIYSQKPSIKASSFKLLHISYFGIYILVASTIIWILNSTVINEQFIHILCQIFWAWLLPIGFTLSFGPIAMRTYRTYRIFEHYLNPGPLISNPILIGGVLLLVLADFVLAMIWTVYDTFYVREDIQVVKGNLGYNIVEVRSVCHCVYYHIWLSLIMSYKFCLLSLVTIFVILTRKVSNNTFATNALRVLVYLQAILYVLGLSLYFVLSLNADSSSVALTVSLNLNILVFILCVFMPPLLPIGKALFQKAA